MIVWIPARNNWSSASSTRLLRRSAWYSFTNYGLGLSRRASWWNSSTHLRPSPNLCFWSSPRRCINTTINSCTSANFKFAIINNLQTHQSLLFLFQRDDNHLVVEHVLTGSIDIFEDRTREIRFIVEHGVDQALSSEDQFLIILFSFRLVFE